MSAASELRKAIFKASNAHDLYDDGVDAILDAVIAALPEELDTDGSFGKWVNGYNDGVEAVQKLLQSAKTQKGEE